MNLPHCENNEQIIKKQNHFLLGIIHPALIFLTFECTSFPCYKLTTLTDKPTA